MNKDITVYLGGSISGLDYDEAVDWRETAARALTDSGIRTRSPMRDKPILRNVGQLHSLGYSTDTLTTAEGVVTRDFFDVQQSDIILMNLTLGNKASIGSLVEMGWATALRKPVITILDVTDPNNTHNHVFVHQLSSIIVPDLAEALHVIISMAG